MLCFHCISVVKWMFILKCPMPSHKTSGSSFKILYGRLSHNWEVGAFLQVALFRDTVVFTDRFCKVVSSVYCRCKVPPVEIMLSNLSLNHIYSHVVLKPYFSQMRIVRDNVKCPCMGRNLIHCQFPHDDRKGARVGGSGA